LNSRYVYKNGKKLRTGYTTGSSAAAAAKAAVWMLIHQEPLKQVSIDTPKGWKLTLDIKDFLISSDEVKCCVVKDAGDDPDITDGLEIWAKAIPITSLELKIIGGKGVGNVTRSGLSVSPGNPAINPVPMEMIRKEVQTVLNKDMGAEIEISIPQGEEIAKKTFNPKLGIVDGLSILGTSGIVEPMSEDAIKDTIALELKVHRKAGNDTIVLVPGNYGEKFLKKQFSIPMNKMVKISNYLGFALETCAQLGYKKVIVGGHIGKLVKTAGGIFYTHSRISTTRMEILAAYLAVLGMTQQDIIRIMDCRTTEEALPIIDDQGFGHLYQVLANKCASNCEEYVYGSLEVGAALFSMDRMLSCSDKTKLFMEDLQNA
jgi:cobalt-precorrin-5B (C1)-methyltransferase